MYGLVHDFDSITVCFPNNVNIPLFPELLFISIQPLMIPRFDFDC